MTMSLAPGAWPADRAGATLTIDLAAIAANYRLLGERAAGAVCAPVVKADAYGLGAARVAPVLEAAGARDFFVAHVDEGIALRRYVSPDVKITILHGPRPGAVDDCVRHDLRPVLNSMEQLASWRQAAGRHGRRLAAALQVDSGMSRFGLSPHDVRAIAADRSLLAGIDTDLVISHLACADDPANPASAAQRAQFRHLASMLPRAPLSLAASSGIFLGEGYHFDLVRPGAALYGVAPTAAAPNPLHPVVRLRAHVMQIRDIAPGDGVGYGLTYRAAAPRRIATIATGYADGFARQGASRGCAWLDDIRLPVVGRISMDSLALDISDVPDSRLSPDMTVDLIGPRRGVDAVAEAAGTIGYEILTALGHRYHRDYIAA
ncbi:alanine racemase [Nguyenibacter sp. L1]|uniref:alanine racemase n=1 Tax=Nguyenibacter sp. L1 TaxID=3049350 RepID=UPI002B4662C5|nr:alanine racemase [Nguyenibacter sp. L1]WRH88924.1 alanine racemase [Nguyenibacter sp. L1]